MVSAVDLPSTSAPHSFNFVLVVTLKLWAKLSQVTMKAWSLLFTRRSSQDKILKLLLRPKNQTGNWKGEPKTFFMRKYANELSFYLIGFHQKHRMGCSPILLPVITLRHKGKDWARLVCNLLVLFCPDTLSVTEVWQRGMRSDPLQRMLPSHS